MTTRARARVSLFFFAWALAVQLTALYTFTRGFFLTRVELPFRSECDLSTLVEGEELLHLERVQQRHAEGIEHPNLGCWVPPRYKRFMWVVVDALRFDFAKWAPNGPADERASFYTNKLPTLRDAILGNATHGCKAQLYQFEADPPTVTMQRLKGLTTGSLPTFLDFRNNFHSPEIEEDNWVHQLRHVGKKLVFMGDDTWSGLYPGDFMRAFPFPSFNTRDLHTVDDGVLQHMGDEMLSADWTGLIIHFLGVDHVGHTFGPSSTAMAAKLAQMDSALSQLFSAAEDDTLILVMGDHGMTGDGNHGGATEEETGAALLLLSKRQSQKSSTTDGLLFDGHDQHAIAAARLPAELLDASQNPGRARRVAQIDLVPTLSLLVGSPIPFASLGGIIPELFLGPEDAPGSTMSLEPLADALLVNCLQVWRYLESYSESSGLPSAELFSLYSVLQVARSLHSEHRGGRGESGSLLSAVQHYRQFLNGSIGLGRRLWTQYDLLLMALGTFLQATFLAVLATRLLIGSNSSLMPAAPMLIWGSALGLIVGAGLAAAAPVHLQPEGVASIAAAGSCLGLLVHMFKGRHNLLPSDFSPRSWSAEEWAAGMVTVLYCGCLFSNSFIIEEHGLHLFLGSTALVVLACMYYKQDPVAAGLCAVAVICLRTAAASTSLFVGTDVSATFSVPTSILPLPLILAIFLRSLHACRWYWVHSGVLILSSLCTAAFWWVEVSSGVAVGSSLRIILPRLVYAGSLLGYFVSLNRGSVCEPVAQLRETSIAVVAHFSSILVLLLGPASPVTIFLFIVGAALLARASNIAESKRASSSHKALLPAYPLTLVWAILARASFFFTGHHSQFSRLQVSCAFIGFDEFHFAIGGILLFLNSFGMEVAAVLGLPILLSSPAHRQPLVQLERLSLQFLLLCSARTLLTTVNACVQRRHLMLWAIFAPKLVFDAVMQFVVGASILGLWVLVFHITGPLASPKKQG